jgi:adenine-specific DNA-methyltransferase
MPTLEFKGKPFVYSHHLSVPFRELIVDPEKSLVAKGRKPSLDDNLIIHGDNLEALKALLPHYAGQVDVIYIDPPYNTGEEGWAYNDNVNSPLMKEWLGKVVDRDDLERHDKWLCMMWPRLQLLFELLAEQGSLWISCDDSEAHHLRTIVEEIDGPGAFIDAIVWQKNYSPKSTANQFSSDHDYILAFSKVDDSWRPGLLPRTAKQDAAYRNPDKDPRGDWKPGGLDARNPYSKGVYPITTPSGRVVPGPPPGNFWRISEERLKKLDADKRIWWGKDGSNVPAIKRFLSEVKRGRGASDALVLQRCWSYAGSKEETF